MLCIPIVGPSLPEVISQVKEGITKGSVLELRLDRMQNEAIEKLQTIRGKIPIPIIFSCRKKEQGGYFSKSENERLDTINQLAQLQPDYFDLEYDTPCPFLQEFAKKFPKIRLILSYHNFFETPLNLESLLQEMRYDFIHFYKLACKANSTTDSLRMLAFVRKHGPLLGICMGEKGTITRILGPAFGNLWTFAYTSPTQKTAEGQFSIDELKSIYPRSLAKTSSVFGLIGSPITQSISHLTHNKVMEELDLDAVYVKMHVEKAELRDFFLWAKQIGIRGLSVTMPLKEDILPYVDNINVDAAKIKAVNTLFFHDGKISGFNTDGKGALDAIEAKMRVRNKKIVVLGAGGSARAIVYEAILRGAHALVLNRTKEKALRLAVEFGVEGHSLADIERIPYDILINTTAHDDPISVSAIRPETLVMDIKTMPKITPLLRHAQTKNCLVIYGYEMFVNQAVAQFDIWFPSQLNREKVHQVLRNEALKCL